MLPAEQNFLVNSARVLDADLRLQDSLSHPATKLSVMRTPKYFNVSVKRENISYLTGNMVIEEEEKTNPEPTSCSKSDLDVGNDR